MAERLEVELVDDRLAGSPWRRDEDAIVLDREFPNFAVAWGFATQVAEAAERADHHPDILVHGWNKVQVTLSTHSAGGITELDLGLAVEIDAIDL